MRYTRFLSLMLFAGAAATAGNSVYTARIEDAKAQYLTRASFAVHGDGAGDDTAVIQAAIDKVEETAGEGVLFIPEGRYRITHTVFVWPGVRIIGYGKTRPVMVLSDRTPGYDKGVADMFFYAGFRMRQPRGDAAAAPPGGMALGSFRFPDPPPGAVPPARIPDANPGTFYSAMSNVDFEIGEGNGGAVAVRFHAAQHAFLAHIDFHLGSGLAGIHDAGNEGEDLHFYGGRYGILTKKPSPAWQFTLIDSTFEGQREAAIRENEAQLTLVHITFRNVPTAVAIDRDYSDQLWIKDSMFDNISGPAIIVSNEQSRLTQVNVENAVCRNVAVFVQFRESGKTLPGRGAIYEVKTLGHGLMLPAEGAAGTIQTKYVAEPLSAMPPAKPNAIAALPQVGEWFNLRDAGAVGDGKTDDTAAIRKAVAEHRVVYAPAGYYVVTDTIALRPDSVLIALHPDVTQFVLPDRTPAFQGPGAPRAIVEAPLGGKTILYGLGIAANGVNSRAVGALWMAGADSMVNDVRFHGGHGTNGTNGKRINPYNNTHTSDPDIHRRWDSQYPSLWVKGGGGTFANIWTPDTFSQTGLYVSDTTVPGRVYELSSEHHVRNEIMLKNVANWELYSLQTEGESGESAFAYSLDIEGCHNLTIANYHGYRVVRSYQPFPYAVRVGHSRDIRFRNFHVDNNSSIAGCANGCVQLVRAGRVSYADAIVNETSHTQVRDREFAWLDLNGKGPAPQTSKAAVEKIASGFVNLSGGAADSKGNLYFVDVRRQNIYRISADAKDVTLLRQNPLEPVNLTVDKAGNVIVLSTGGMRETVYAFRPDAPDDQMTVLERQPAQARPGVRVALPVDYWVNGDFSNTLNVETYEYVTLDERFRAKMSARKPFQYVSPDGSVYIPANEAFIQGEPYFGHKWTDILMPTGLVQTEPGKTFYVTNESDQRTYSGKVNDDGTLSDLKVFAYQGGESLAQDGGGKVYLAAGQIYVYSKDGKPLDIIRVPERPTHLVFGGPDGRTLFILTNTSVFATRVQ